MLSIRNKYQKNHDNDYLNDKSYRDLLYKVFEYYNDMIQEPLDLVVILCDGQRPLNVENEIFAAFHHIARSIFHAETYMIAKEELNKAINTHLKRTTLDIYKLLLDSILTEIKTIHTLIMHIIVDEDIKNNLPDGTKIANKVEKIRKNIRKYYLSAKMKERIGLHDDAIEDYKRAYEEATESIKVIDQVKDNQTFKYIAAKINKRQQERKEDRQFTWKIAIASSLIAGILSLGGAIVFYYTGCPSNSLSQPVTSHIKK